MSRHILRSDAEYEVVVGYDDPMDTFFAQVYDVTAGDEADDDVLVVWTGGGVREITDPLVALNAVEKYLTTRSPWVRDLDQIARTLNEERESRRSPTAFQRETFHRFTGDNLP